MPNDQILISLIPILMGPRRSSQEYKECLPIIEAMKGADQARDVADHAGNCTDEHNSPLRTFRQA